MMIQAIEWRAVQGYEGSYEVSFEGQVRSVTRDRDGSWGSIRTFESVILAQVTDKHGYKRVGFRFPGKRKKSFIVHRLVAIAFIPNPDEKPFINHKNGVKTDNRVENLEWVTASENMEHAVRTGLLTGIGETSYLAKLTEAEVLEIVAMSQSGMRYKDIALRFNVRLSTVGEIMRGGSWGEITGIKSARKPKTSDENVREIVSRIAAGELICDVATSFGITKSAVKSIISGRNRGSVTGIKK